jgi:MATE family multidrug resistance protein
METPLRKEPGASGEVLRLALPLILSSSVLTLQVFIGRVLLSRYDLHHGAAVVPAVMMFWTPFALLFHTASYVSTFVAQYLGAGRPRRIGPATWQALYFSVLAGVAFLGLVPLADAAAEFAGHAPEVRDLEAAYFRCLCFSALPALLTATASGFFAGRGDTWTVLLINAVGMVVNVVLAYLWIFGLAGFPEWGVEGAGWAIVAGDCSAAGLGLLLLFRRRHEAEFATRSGWRFEPALFGRLLRFGVPAGLQWAIDTLAFNLFVILVGRLGVVELTATGIAGNLNLIVFLPAMGMGQAVAVLVGQHLGRDRPDRAERSVWAGARLAWVLMTAVALLYVLVPGPLMSLFQGNEEHPSADWAAVGEMVVVLLRFVAAYCLFDSLNLVLSSALRGAGDTRFVTWVVLVLSFPIVVVPAWASWHYGWGVYWAWGFASVYVAVLALTFLWRFRQGKWKSMRVIEAAVEPDVGQTGRPAEEAQAAEFGAPAAHG